MDTIIFIVSRPDHSLVENVIVPAKDREEAKQAAHNILLGNPDHYVVDPITKHGSRTVVLLATR